MVLNSSVDKERLREILAGRLQDILDEFQVELRGSYGKYVGCCPIHGGDNLTGFTITESGAWRCWTHHCQTEYGCDPIGLIWGLLAGGKERPHFSVVMKWVSSFLKGDLPMTSASFAENNKFLRASGQLARRPSEIKGYDSNTILNKLTIPSPYFLSRGYTPEILRQFSVGEPKEQNPGKPLYQRAVVPVFDASGARITGMSGRTLNAACGTCGKFHPPGNCWACPKWFHHNLKTGDVLYGWHLAEKSIGETGEVRIVEGCPDVWAWHASGFPNTVGIFGTTVTENQQVLLEQSGALTIILGQDADEAGDLGAKSSCDKLSHIFNVKRLRPPMKDWGECFERGLACFGN